MTSTTKDPPLVKIPCSRNDEEEGHQVEVTPDIRLSEFIREVRLKLKILDADRIYVEKDGAQIDEKKISVGPCKRDDPLTSIHSFMVPENTSRMIFVIDMKGIVRSKS